jgi:netrin-G3 ligand
MTAVEDLDLWQQKTVGLTESADLSNLEKFAQYAVAVAARTKQVNHQLLLYLILIC